MTPKERLLQMKTYEEYERKRGELKGLKPDKEVIEHLSKLFGRSPNPQEELYSYLPDGRKVLGGQGNTKKPDDKEMVE